VKKSEQNFRSRIDQGATRLRISIPLATSESARLHINALLVIWLLGAALAATSLVLQEPLLGPHIVHVLWLLAGIPVLWAFARFAIGREVITISEGKLMITKQPYGMIYRKRYHLSKVRRIRIDRTGLRLNDRRHRLSPLRWRGERGLILFDYDFKAVRFGRGLSVPEAKHILGIIRESAFIDSEQVEI
jgi:hypothetical protein